MASPGPTAAAESLSLADQAEALLAQGQIERAVDVARSAAIEGRDPVKAWLVFARASDARSDDAEAFAAYRKAMELSADPGEVLVPMGRAALRLGEPAVAENILARAIESGADGEAILDLAWAQIRQAAFDRAQATLQTALQADPLQPRLWLTLGEMLCLAGRCAEAVIFFEEAIRLDPALAPAHAGLAEALLLGGGDGERALAESARALALAGEADRPRAAAGHGRRLLACGAVGEGFATFAQWLQPGPAAGVEVRVAAAPWRPGAPFEGRLLVIGEETLAEDILFASVLPVLAADTPDLILALDPRWRGLAERSFPGALVVPQLRRIRHGRRQLTAELDSPHVHAGALVGAWASLRSLLAAYRASPAQVASHKPYLQPDPRRIAQWKAWLGGLGPGLKAGVRWRAADTDYRTWRQTPPLPALQDALAQPGVCVVPLQEAETGELAALEAAGVVVRRPPGLDRSDLGDLGALCCALDLVVGAPDAVTHLAAACGAQTCFLVSPRHWALLGEETYPWFPKARVIASLSFDDWGPAMAALSGTLAALAA